MQQMLRLFQDASDVMTASNTGLSRPAGKYPSWDDEGGAGAFFDRIEELNSQGQFVLCCEAIDHLPVRARDYRTAFVYARAVQNLAVCGYEPSPDFASETRDNGLPDLSDSAALASLADPAALMTAVSEATAFRQKRAAATAAMAIEQYDSACAQPATRSSRKSTAARNKSLSSGRTVSKGMPRALVKILRRADTARFTPFLPDTPGCSVTVQGPPDAGTLLMITSLTVLDEVSNDGIHDPRFHLRKAWAWLFLNEPVRARACAAACKSISNDAAAALILGWADTFKDEDDLEEKLSSARKRARLFWPAGRDRPYGLPADKSDEDDYHAQGDELVPPDGRDVIELCYRRHDPCTQSEFYHHHFHASLISGDSELNFRAFLLWLNSLWDIQIEAEDIFTTEATHLNARSERVYGIRYNNMTALLSFLGGQVDVHDLIRHGLGASQVAHFSYRDSILAHEAGLDTWEKASINPHGSFGAIDALAKNSASHASGRDASAQATDADASAAGRATSADNATASGRTASAGSRSGARSERPLKPWKERARRLLKRRLPHKEGDPPELTAMQAADDMYLHRGRIEVSLHSRGQHPLAAGVFFTQIMRTLCISSTVRGMVINGGLFRTDVFCMEAERIFNQILPVDAFIFFGINDDGPVPSVYTRGLRSLGMNEIEVSYPGEDPEVLLSFLRDAVNIILTRDITLQDGQDADLRGLLHHKIELSAGINIPDYTFKINYDLSYGASTTAASPARTKKSADKPDKSADKTAVKSAKDDKDDKAADKAASKSASGSARASRTASKTTAGPDSEPLSPVSKPAKSASASAQSAPTLPATDVTAAKAATASASNTSSLSGRAQTQTEQKSAATTEQQKANTKDQTLSRRESINSNARPVTAAESTVTSADTLYKTESTNGTETITVTDADCGHGRSASDEISHKDGREQQSACAASSRPAAAHAPAEAASLSAASYGFTPGDLSGKAPGITVPSGTRPWPRHAAVLVDDSHVYSRMLKGTQRGQDRLSTITHMALFLRWAIRRHLVSSALEQKYPHVIEQVNFGNEKFDLRQFIYDEFAGRISDDIFNDAGRSFVQDYWQKETLPNYFEDLRIIAQDSPALEQLDSPAEYELSFTALPFNDSTWDCVRAVLNSRLSSHHNQYVQPVSQECEATAWQLMRFLDCPCTLFPAMADDSPLIASWQAAKTEGEKDGFVPVMIPAEPLMLQMLINRSGCRAPLSRQDTMGPFDLTRLQAVRQNMVSSPLPDGAALLEAQIEKSRRRIEEHGWSWEDHVTGRAMRKVTVTRFQCIWDFQTSLTRPMILARIPAAQPWHVFAWLPWELRRYDIGITEFMAVARYFYEQYGAVLSVMSSQELEFSLPAALKKKDRSLKAAYEYFALCPNIIELNSGNFRPDLYDKIGNVATLASTLSRSRIWYFNWELMWRRSFARNT